MMGTKLRCDVIMLATPQVEEYARYSRLLWTAYCARRDYQFRHYPDRLVLDMHINWSKVEMVRRHLIASNADIVVLVDADTYVCDPDMSLTGMLDQSSQKSMVFAPDTVRYGRFELPLNVLAAATHRTMRLPNAGFIVMENSKFTRQFFDDWLDLARNKFHHLADKHPRNQRVLWQGLFFQYRDKIGLLDKQVRRLQREDQLDRAMHEGCNVAHVSGGLSQSRVEDLIQKFG